MLKRTISADAYNGLPEDIKSHYVKRGNSYVLDLEGNDPELEATQSQLDSERKKNIELSSQVRTLTTEVQTKEEKVREETKKELETLREQNSTLLNTQIDAERTKHIDAIAANFKLDNLIRADLQSRVTVEYKDGEIKTSFKNKDGKEVDFKTLNEEYCKNPDYSAILKDNSSTPTFTPPKPGKDNGGAGGDGGNGNQSGGLNYNKATPADVAARLNNIN